MLLCFWTEPLNHYAEQHGSHCLGLTPIGSLWSSHESLAFSRDYRASYTITQTPHLQEKRKLGSTISITKTPALSQLSSFLPLPFCHLPSHLSLKDRNIRNIYIDRSLSFCIFLFHCQEAKYNVVPLKKVKLLNMINFSTWVNLIWKA